MGRDASKSGSAGSSPLEVVILNQYYVPDVASTGHLLHELAQELVELGFEVNVVTGRPSYGPKSTWQPVELREVRDGVRVRRMLTTRFSKDNLFGRVFNFCTFMGPLFVRMLLKSRKDVIYLYTTNPPFLGIIGALVSLVRRHNYVLLLHDAYPQIAVWVGTIRGRGFIDRVWHRTNRFIYGRAAQTIVLCKKAKELVRDTYSVPEERLHVIPNWADREKLFPKPKRETDFAEEHGLRDVFTVMYSGNLGLYYEFETILKAAEILKDEDFRLVFIGSGGKRGWIEEQIRERGLTNTVMLPYQPFETLNDSLNACDASLVTIAEGIEGISFPSKLYSSLAIGKPVLALSEPDSELRTLVHARDVGGWFALGDAEGLAEGIRKMRADSAHAEAQGRNARALFEERFTRQASGAMYADVMRTAAGVATESDPEHTGKSILE